MNIVVVAFRVRVRTIIPNTSTINLPKTSHEKHKAKSMEKVMKKYC